ncbi:hypothetical protein E2562_033614 [Oryza meyeriana var. granulata]|uniref:F-box domain-containing protein n=1 Tax=Oryza meyeriana var. granulata TaxID=110450 RepID=A0A6G1FFB0_9ORYZ|nr:hypothetical protein E2562_033614 [Oryza meyeriana var. granulata]
MAEAEGESRDWAEMPSDALAAVFGKLDVTDLLNGAGLVCRAWRRLAASDPTLWRRVDMSHHGDIMEDDEAEAMARAAVDRAAGTMEAFWADSFVTDGLLLYISERASSLKSLQLSMCLNVSNEGMAEAMKGFPHLEELDITFCSLYGDVCASVGKACPELKCFRLNERYTFQMEYVAPDIMDDDTEALGIASNMPELQELQLIGNKVTNDGLMSILDHCQHLESLDIRQCYSIQMDDALKSKCARIRNLKLPHDSISDFKYRAYIVSNGAFSGSDLEVDMYDDLLDVVTDDFDADFDDMDDYDDAGSDGAMYDDEFDI